MLMAGPTGPYVDDTLVLTGLQESDAKYVHWSGTDISLQVKVYAKTVVAASDGRGACVANFRMTRRGNRQPLQPLMRARPPQSPLSVHPASL